MSAEIETVVVPVSDGTEMALYVARPEQAPGGRPAPGLLVLQEAFGVNGHIRDVARSFAGEGYLAVAPELFHRTAPRGFEGSYTDFGSIMPHMQAITPATLEADLRAAYDWLTAEGRADRAHVGSIGYCMGGRATYLANAVLPLQAAVSYYGGRIAPDLLPRAAEQHGPILLFWGGKDQHIGPEQQRAVADALRAAGKTFVDVEFSQADHGFFCDERKSYNPEAARQSWALTLEFLRTYLSPEG